VIGPAQTVAWYQSLVLDGRDLGRRGRRDRRRVPQPRRRRAPGRAFTIVLPDDLARFLRNQSGVDRVQVINNYDADTSTAASAGT
jgi:hypothetical protein